ncbi:MAG: methionine synthase [Gammaproteobacteria bacterium RIFCSPLOWO2_02_FULL_56_15]|nr:MAG: methionine synthase [Gammaproteobacteria bacterium RIFCSPLOWO2_02_FULL_56_15]
MSEQHQKLIELIADMNEEGAIKLANDMLDNGYDPMKLLEHCRAGMDVVGKRFESGEYFLPELMLAGEMLSEISKKAKPLIVESQSGGEAANKGVVLIGTVHGDLHDIGKNIVTFMLDINGYKVIDLGIDVPIDTFIDSIKEHQPSVVGLSGFLTLAFDSMKETIDAIQSAGLRDDIKIMIGGGQVDDTIRNYTGADAFGLNAMSAVSLCNGWAQATA